MTHRIPDRRWLDNPERRVGKAQLNRVEEAANTDNPPSESQQREPDRPLPARDRIPNQ